MKGDKQEKIEEWCGANFTASKVHASKAPGKLVGFKWRCRICQRTVHTSDDPRPDVSRAEYEALKHHVASDEHTLNLLANEGDTDGLYTTP